MPAQTYAYTGRDAAGKLHKGRLEAPTEGAVAARLRTMGMSPVDVKPAGNATGLNREINLGMFGGNVKLKDLAVMARQMATMISSGLSLMRTLTILSEQTENPKLRETLDAVRKDVEAGSSLMAPSLKDVDALLEGLETKGVEYTIADATITATVADAPFVIAELDEAAGTFTFTTLRPPKSSSRSGKMPTFEAGGIYNAAKRGALIGRKPSQNAVKDALSEALAAAGWTRGR